MTAPATTPELEFVFNPRSIAIAGVSAKETAAFGGGGFVSSLQEIGFRGPIYLIHPTAPAIRGLRCYKTLLEIPDEVDYVISSVNARFVPQLLEECITKGVRCSTCSPRVSQRPATPSGRRWSKPSSHGRGRPGFASSARTAWASTSRTHASR
ncbi:MAG: CoA-binding protein [Dehalococcoidia bacterium]|uniref:CoA-binding protein n=1 Tax=Candidatus Amarobacter glycogenicus TaxID=3140699 RepID=UPI0031367254|nr:CoA-binding protein [Dehalococcoidia bacterium]